MPYRPKIYLDNCCFSRPYDNQSQLIIRRETEAVLRIRDEIENGRLELCWSFVLDIENNAKLDSLKINAVNYWKSLSTLMIEASKQIRDLAKKLEQQGIKTFDALHVACAVASASDYFISTDIRLLKKTVREVRTINPVEFVRLIKEIDP
jgi:predicted nucleic acid-binding protein